VVVRTKIYSILVSLFIIVVASLFLKPRSLVSAPPTNVKDTLSSSQLSYFARLSSGTTQVGDSILKVVASGNPSNTTNNLFVGDTIAIGTTGIGVGSSGPLTLYTVKDISSTAAFTINSGIGQSNAFVNAAIVATRSAIHTISFTPQSNSTGGYWEFLIKATSRTGEQHNDGIPDQQGFDLGATTPSSGANGLGTRLKITDVTCPNWGTGATTAYSVGTTVVLNIGYTGSSTPTSFNVVSCYLGVGGTNQIGTSYTVTIGAALASGSQLINPAPATSRTEGNADVYSFLIRHKDSSSALIDADTVQGKIAVVESVRVTATVEPTLTFAIDNTNVGTGGTPCGLAAFGSNAANTSATSVAFGSLNVAAVNDLAQRLSAVTNASDGYIVTVYEDGNLKEISNGTTIPDTTCPSNSCDITTPAVWNTYTASGWGYTLQNINVGTSIFNYAAGHRAFGNGAANAKTIISNTSTPTTTEIAYICYRIVASTTQKEGTYEGKLIYTATATF